MWQVERLHHGFCVQLLVNPAQLDDVPKEARLLRADQVKELHPALARVVEGQAEYAAWSPSSICLYYLTTVDLGSGRVHADVPRKAPLLGFWTVAAVDSSGARQDIALELMTTNGRLERAAAARKLKLREARSTEDSHEETSGPPGSSSYQLQVGKTRIYWDGHPSRDSVPAKPRPVERWRTAGSRGGWISGELELTPQWSRAMIGSIRIEGKGAMAKALLGSPIRFVGPLLQGGTGRFRFGY